MFYFVQQSNASWIVHTNEQEVFDYVYAEHELNADERKVIDYFMQEGEADIDVHDDTFVIGDLLGMERAECWLGYDGYDADNGAGDEADAEYEAYMAALGQRIGKLMLG